MQKIQNIFFRYAAYDSSGTKIIEDLMTIDFSDSNHLTENWGFSALTQTHSVGSQVGTGQLIGSVQNKEIHLNLTPNFNDNNVMLIGSLTNRKIIGKWMWITFIGVSNQSAFEAIKI